MAAMALPLERRMPLAKVWLVMAGLALAAAPALARPKPPPLPPLELPLAAPFITASIAGKPVRLRVDPGGETHVSLTPAAMQRLALAADWPRADGKPPGRGVFTLAIGQLRVKLPFSVEMVDIAGRRLPMRVVQSQASAEEAWDGEIGVVALPHDDVLLTNGAIAPAEWRQLPARWGNGQGSATAYFSWPLPTGQLDVELHPFRPTSIANVAAASQMAAAAGGQLLGPQRQVPITLGYARPVRTMQLAGPLAIAGLPLTSVDVRLFDWSGKANLPPDAEADGMLTVTARTDRQRAWPLLRLGHDVLAACRGFAFHRATRQIGLACPPG